MEKLWAHTSKIFLKMAGGRMHTPQPVVRFKFFISRFCHKSFFFHPVLLQLMVHA